MNNLHQPADSFYREFPFKDATFLLILPSKSQFIFIPEAGDYNTEVPVEGDYIFEIISVSDEKLTGKVIVGDEKLAAITIKTSTLSSHLLKTTWDKVTGADFYLVSLYSANKSEILFSSSFLDPDKVEYEFGSTTSGWAAGKSPIAGTDYIIELTGIKIETGTSYDKGNNIQFLTKESKTIKWE